MPAPVQLAASVAPSGSTNCLPVFDGLGRFAHATAALPIGILGS
jgi:hypothetical protein